MVTMRARFWSFAVLLFALAQPNRAFGQCEPLQRCEGTDMKYFCCPQNMGCGDDGCNNWVDCDKNDQCLRNSCNIDVRTCTCEAGTDCGNLGTCNNQTQLCEKLPPFADVGCNSTADCDSGVCTFDDFDAATGTCRPQLPNDDEPSFTANCGIGASQTFGTVGSLLFVFALGYRIRERYRSRAAGRKETLGDTHTPPVA
jgi:hypothetical protein